MKRSLVVLALVACNSSDDPFLLDHARVLAVRSEPAHAPPGTLACLDVLVADAAGDVVVAAPDAVDAGGLPITGSCVTAPGPLAPIATVAVTVDGESLAATKQLVFGDRRDNPSVAAMELDGAAAPEIDLASGDTASLEVPGDDGVRTYAWYTSIGSLAHYRSVVATLDGDELGDGVVVVVVRDDQGGVAWQLVPAHVR
jgi:hypothetical protein